VRSTRSASAFGDAQGTTSCLALLLPSDKRPPPDRGGVSGASGDKPRGKTQRPPPGGMHPLLHKGGCRGGASLLRTRVLTPPSVGTTLRSPSAASSTPSMMHPPAPRPSPSPCESGRGRAVLGGGRSQAPSAPGAIYGGKACKLHMSWPPLSVPLRTEA
jgi:hypothetical protein